MARSDELKVQNDIRLQLGADPAIRLWRNNTGALKDQSGRLVRYGLCQGSSGHLFNPRPATGRLYL